MMARGVTAALSLMAFAASAWLDACGSPTFVVDRLNVVPLADVSRQERRLLDAVLEGRLSDLDLMLSGSRGSFGINTVLCFHEAAENSFVAENEDAIQPYEIDAAVLMCGVNLWMESKRYATHGELFWRTYPKSMRGSCPYGYMRLYGTPLMIAARNRNVPMVRELLKRGAEPNVFVRLGNEMLYAAKEAYRGASSERDREKAREILKLLAAAKAVQLPGDSLANSAAPSLPSAFAAAIADEEAERLRVAQVRQGKRNEAWAAFNGFMAQKEREQAERDRKAAEAAEIRQRAHEARLQAMQDHADLKLWLDSGQTRGQWEASQRLGLKRYQPYGYGQGTFGSRLFKDSDGRLYDIDANGNVRAIQK